MELLESAKTLYRLAAQFHLYINLRHQKGKPDVGRLIKEIETMKQLILRMEATMNGQ